MTRRFTGGLDEGAIGWVPIAAQATTMSTQPKVIQGTTGHGLKWRRFVFVVRNKGLVPVYLGKQGDISYTAIEIKTTGVGDPAILGPFDAIAMPYYLRTFSSTAACVISVMASEHGEPEQLIAGA